MTIEDLRDELGERFRGRSISVSKTAWLHGSFPLTNRYSEYVITIQPGFDKTESQNFGGNSLRECLDKFNQSALHLPDITGATKGNINRPEIL